MNKKIGLVTCYFQPNYGSQLQAYATQEAVGKLGFEAETIRIDGLRREINRAKWRYFLSRIFDGGTVSDKMATVRKVVAKARNRQYADSLAERYAKFAEFAGSMFRLSERCVGKADLARRAHGYGAFVVGSDQLWLPSNIAAGYYTLEWVPDGIRTVAYATSFGVSELPRRQAAEAARFLRRIDHIGVREQSGQRLVAELAGRSVPIVCDPTLLFTAEEWDRVAACGSPAQGRYIFCYFLGNNPGHREWTSRLRAHSGCKVVQMQHCDEYIMSDEGFADEAPYDVGPREFIRLIKDAEYVVTDSFHCTVFSMLYRKSFFTFRRYGSDGGVSTNGRIYSLLSLTGLEDRLLRGDEDAGKAAGMGIDYGRVHATLDALRRGSYDWLGKALAQG